LIFGTMAAGDGNPWGLPCRGMQVKAGSADTVRGMVDPVGDKQTLIEYMNGIAEGRTTSRIRP
jgi:hypothetical protein